MLGEITEAALMDEPDIELRSRPRDVRALARVLEEGGADVVILGSKRKEAATLARSLLTPRRRVRLLAISDDGRASFMYELRPFEVPLGEVSPRGLLEAVRG